VPKAGKRWSWLPRERPTLVTLARYDTYHKGLDYLSLLASALPEVDILVYGVPDHNETELIAAVVRSAPPNFSLKPPIMGIEKQRVLATASLYVQASRWEGLSISLIEALGVGVPVVVSQQVADTVPIEERGMGLVMSPDPWLAAATIRDLIADHDRQLEMSTAGTRWVEEALTPDRVVTRLETTYALAVGER
jgi:glycosyltransferase involved in cell wall biosynthesis